MTYIIAVANQKGGVAKTTTVVSLGGEFARIGYEVLMIDLDGQSNLSLAMGLDPTRMRGTSLDVLMNSASIHSVSRETTIPGLDIVPSNGEMDLAERFLTVRKNHETILREALQAHDVYDFVILDCPPFMGSVTLNALVVANMLIIPSQPEYFSAHALRAMMTAIRKVREQYNPLLIYRILLTMHDRRNRIHNHLSDQIRSTFGDGLFQTMIEVDTKLRESAVAGMPISLYKAQTRSAIQYQSLAQEIISYVEQTAKDALQPLPARQESIQPKHIIQQPAR